MKSLASALCLTLAALAALLWLYHRKSQAHEQATSRLFAMQARTTALETDRATLTEQNQSLQQQAQALQTRFDDAQSRLAIADANNAQLSKQLAESREQLAARERAGRNLQQQIAGLERDLADARAAIVPPETIEAYRNAISQLERELASTRGGTVAPGVIGASDGVFANRASVSANVLSVGPSSSFVVLDYGATRGAVAGQRLIVRRGTETVAEALISDVRSSVSIAHVRPDSLRGVLHRGDSAVLTQQIQ